MRAGKRVRERAAKALAFLLAVLFLMQAPAFAEEEVNCVMSQYGSAFDLPYGNGTLISVSGCRMFSLAHGIQWVNGAYYGESLVYELAAQVPGDKFAGSTPNSAFAPVLAEYGVTMVPHSRVIRSFAESEIRRAFCEGWVFQVNIWTQTGHFALAADYVYCKPSETDPSRLVPVEDDGESCPPGCAMYVQIIDSLANATTGFTSVLCNVQCYVYEEGELVPYCYYEGWNILPQVGMQYWIAYSDFTKISKRMDDDVALHGAWTGHDKIIDFEHYQKSE